MLASGWMLLAGPCACAGRNDGSETVPAEPDDCGRSALQQRSVARAGRVVGPELGPEADGTPLL